jgi:hypothetical protein
MPDYVHLFFNPRVALEFMGVKAGRPEGYPYMFMVPFLFLVETSDIPEHLHLTSWEDPRLHSESYLQEVEEFLKSFLGLQKFEKNFLSREDLKLFLKFLDNPKLAAEARDFLIEREIEHLYLEHPHKESGSKGQFLISILLGAAVLMAYGVFLPLSSLTLLIGLGLSVAVAKVSQLALKELSQIYHTIGEEKIAELAAAQKYRRGGIYLYETVRRHALAFRKGPHLNWKERVLSHLLVNSQGDKRFFINIDDPRETTRLKYLGKYI